MAPPQAILLLFFLHLLPLGGRSRPPGSLRHASEPSQTEELLYRPGDKASELQTEQMALETAQLDKSPVEAQRVRRTASKDSKDNTGPQDRPSHSLQERNKPKRQSGSSCFGRKIDRIGHSSSFGCNVLR